MFPEDVAERMLQEKQVLCIVNTKADAQEIYKLISGPNTYCLTTAMTPQERCQVISKIKNKKDDEVCRVVATSLVEAGVDIDFPCVYKALAGLDSILQAAGRCNREGKYPYGVVHVMKMFNSVYLPKDIYLRISATELVISNFEALNDPLFMKHIVRDYFRDLRFIICGNDKLDTACIISDCEAFKFKTVADHFHIIENNDFVVYIPTEENSELISKIGTANENKKLWRDLGKYGVSVSSSVFSKLKKQGDVQQISDKAGILTNANLYTHNMGVNISK